MKCSLIIPIPGNFILYSYPNAFERILYNLSANALKYTESGTVEFGYKIIDNKNKLANNLFEKEYRIDASKTDFELEIFAKDTGIGIPENEQKIIFNLFQKLENNRDKLYRGTGLGLAIINDLAKKLHAKINLESKVGSGTYISLTIPLCKM